LNITSSILINRILRDQTSRRLVDKAHKNDCNSMKLTKTLDLLARPRGFEPLTLGLEMRGFVVTNSTELSRFVTLQ
jgi:hypothetical protein